MILQPVRRVARTGDSRSYDGGVKATMEVAMRKVAVAAKKAPIVAEDAGIGHV